MYIFLLKFALHWTVWVCVCDVKLRRMIFATVAYLTWHNYAFFSVCLPIAQTHTHSHTSKQTHHGGKFVRIACNTKCHTTVENFNCHTFFGLFCLDNGLFGLILFSVKIQSKLNKNAIHFEQNSCKISY